MPVFAPAPEPRVLGRAIMVDRSAGKDDVDMSDQLSDFADYGEYRSSNRSGVTLGLALLCLGLAAGAITALLMAPQTGRQLRKQLRRKYEDARDVVDDWSDQASDWIERGSDWADKASDWADKAKSRVGPVRKAFRR